MQPANGPITAPADAVYECLTLLRRPDLERWGSGIEGIDTGSDSRSAPPPDINPPSAVLLRTTPTRLTIQSHQNHRNPNLCCKCFYIALCLQPGAVLPGWLLRPCCAPCGRGGGRAGGGGGGAAGGMQRIHGHRCVDASMCERVCAYMWVWCSEVGKGEGSDLLVRLWVLGLPALCGRRRSGLVKPRPTATISF